MWALIGGIIAVVLGVLLAALRWWQATKYVITGGIVILLVLGGLVAVASGISDIKDRLAEKKEKEQEKEKESAQGPESAEKPAAPKE
ncbi:MAG TPA: hypothetical protein PKN80_03970 [bacterium]|uniref:Uncharacterized protein n=1 Tax=candidate division TA06 bacterium ADurb.Bin417 TaxID=1852828 RepID=A0A1V5MGK4_UNCT6|nr:MAG: hypothetical protein BWY73_00829 [candidate division TA06 bacterium ADurb.Bin417]HNQ35202.1 hypothetical protein [bacterium]HNS48417.1 hypothetical protein [bacterium]